MASNIRIIKYNNGLVIGKLKYVTHSHYYIKRLDKNTSIKIKKEHIKTMHTLDELHATVSDFESESYEKPAKEMKNKKVNTGSPDTVFRVLHEIGALNPPVLGNQ